jgi:hypothetical protein
MSASAFIYPEVLVDATSPALSFHPVTKDNLDIPKSVIPDRKENVALKDLPDFASLWPKPNRQVGAKDFFLGMYGKKDMLSKQVSTPLPASLKKAVLPANFDTGESLLEFGSSDTPGEVVPSQLTVQKKSSLGGLFGSLDEATEETSGSGLLFDSFDDNKIKKSESSVSTASDMFDAFGSFGADTPKKQPAVTAQFVSFDSFSSEPTTAAPSSDPFGFPFNDDPAPISSTGAFGDFDTSDGVSSESKSATTPAVCTYDAMVHIESHEELLCVYRGNPPAVAEFSISGTVGLSLDLAVRGGGVTLNGTGDDDAVSFSLLADDKSTRLAEIVSIDSAVDTALIQSTTTPSMKALKVTLRRAHSTHSVMASDNSRHWRNGPIMRFKTIPSFRPEYIRARTTVTKKESTTPDGLPSYAASVSVQILLNKNFNMFLEDIQVMASLSALGQFSAQDVKSRPPTRAFNAQSKVLTWTCGSHFPSKMPMLQMEALVVLSSNPASLPGTLPVIIKMRTTSSIIPDCSFAVEGELAMEGSGGVISRHSTVNSKTVDVVYKSKIEYRFL